MYHQCDTNDIWDKFPFDIQQQYNDKAKTLDKWHQTQYRDIYRHTLVVGSHQEKIRNVGHFLGFAACTDQNSRPSKIIF